MLDTQYIDEILNLSLPGYDEVMAFLEIAQRIDSGAYASIIVDTAPTGHTLRLLSMPTILRQWLHTLDAMLDKHRYLSELYRRTPERGKAEEFLEEMFDLLKRTTSLLHNVKWCQFVPVLLADALSSSETNRLLQGLREQAIPVVELVVNQLYISEAHCSHCQEVKHGQQRELQRIMQQFQQYALWGLPHRETEVRGMASLSTLWSNLRSAMSSLRMISAPTSDPAPRVHGEPLPIESLSLPILLFAGKGGVGKTTLAAATALRLAQEHPEKQILLFSTDPAHSLSDCLQLEVGPREVPVTAGLTTMEIDAEAEFQTVKQRYADEIEQMLTSALSSTVISWEYDRQVMQNLVTITPPGLDEIMALTRAIELLEIGKYDFLVLDTAPTGHLLRLLELPDMIEEWLRVIFRLLLKYRSHFRVPRLSESLVTLLQRIKRLRALLRNPAKSCICAVSLLTEMCLEETRDLLDSCQHIEITMCALFLNQATPADGCSVCQRANQAEAVVRTKFEVLAPTIPHLTIDRWHEPRGVQRLTQLGQALYCGAAICQTNRQSYG